MEDRYARSTTTYSIFIVSEVLYVDTSITRRAGSIIAASCSRWCRIGTTVNGADDSTIRPPWRHRTRQSVSTEPQVARWGKCSTTVGPEAAHISAGRTVLQILRNRDRTQRDRKTAGAVTPTERGWTFSTPVRRIIGVANLAAPIAFVTSQRIESHHQIGAQHFPRLGPATGTARRVDTCPVMFRCGG